MSFLEVDGRGETIFGHLSEENANFERDDSGAKSLDLMNLGAMDNFSVCRFDCEVVQCSRSQRITSLSFESWT